MADDDADLTPEAFDRESRLLDVVRTYTAAVEAGEKPDRRALMKQHPDLAADLSACLGGLTFLNNAAGQLAATAYDLVDPTAAGPQPLGDYRLLREIGRGGMGVVYEAEQISLGRRVAVKVLPTAAALDSRQLQRFRNEAQAAAQLHHTHIVPVYAVGCERSVHYYAMQLIEGQSLADVIRQLRDTESTNVAVDSSTPTGDLSSLRLAKRQTFYRTVVRLGLQAADALHHAHHAGIVHRDIKPANLLLDSAADVWITDFGLAQFYAEDHNLTQTTDRPGTLRYMSPEQASGDAVVLDQRTDVYSLGVTLYELLTLHPAVPGDTREQMMQYLQHVDLRPAHTIDPAIPRELDTILATACAKDPAERYATAGAFAEDLRRWLADEPILARPPTLAQRSVKWLRRHRALATSAAVVAVLLLAASVVSTVLIARAQVKTQAALFDMNDRAAEAKRQTLRAERAFAAAREAVDFFSRVAATELIDDRPSPEARRGMLEAALDYYEAFLHERQGDPAVARELAEAKTYVSGLLAELSTVEDAYRVRMLVRLAADGAVARDLKLTRDQVARIARLAGDASGSGPRDAEMGGGANAFDRGGMNPGGFGPGGPGGPGGRGRPDGGFGGGPDGGFGGPPDENFGGRGGMGGGGSGGGWQRERVVRTAARNASALTNLLGPGQLERLNQIARQARGPAAFADPDVARSLALTLPQKESVRSALSAARAAARRPTDQPPTGGPIERFDAADVTRDGSMRAVVALLGPGQIAVWHGLIGRPFTDAARLDPDARRPRGPFNGGPPPDEGFGL